MQFTAPASDELEVSIFGPGFGEALAVHVGQGSWILIDSCWQDRIRQVPVSANYLDQLSVAPDMVRQVVASHWHDDHVKGLSKLIEKYQKASLYYPGFLSGKEGKQFLAAYGGKAYPGVTGTKELFQSMIKIKETGRKAYPTLIKSLIFESSAFPLMTQVVAYSPTPDAWDKSMAAHLSQLMPGVAPQNVTQPSTNNASIVMHLRFGDDAVLLGSDLENDGNLGWKSVLTEEWALARTRASLYKVAHHGSQTACSPEIWEKFLVPQPTAGVTPFVNGSVRLPKESDIFRIKKFTENLHITALPSPRTPKGTQAEKQLGTVLKNMTGVSEKMGHIRYRKKLGEFTWRIETSGAARAL